MAIAHPILLLLIALACDALAQAVVPAPIVVEPSQYWEGNDGPWSSFSMRVGIPSQIVRVHISTTNPTSWVVLSEACTGNDQSACNNTRGLTFNRNQSTTWEAKGAFGLYVESNLNYTDTGEFGLETVGFGLSTSLGPTLESQVVAGIITENFYLGNLGLGVQPTNFTDFTNPIPSLFSTLKSRNLIPSLAWSYTAGAPYRLKKVLGSLTFGGYDASRFTPNGLTFPFAPDSSRDLVVGLQSISSTDARGRTTELLFSGILAFVDSTIPYIYLPVEACQQFEDTLGLEWDPTSELYLVSDTLHNSLTARNMNFTFTLGNTLIGGETISIVLPYSSFDLTASAPLLNETSRYFPLKRASNDTQYTLGRAFLQEAYLTADYERLNFSLSQCIFEEGANERIVAIHSLDYQAPSGDSTTGSGLGAGPSNGSSLSTGAIAGVSIAGALILIAFILLALAYRFRKWPFHKRVKAAELDGTSHIDKPLGSDYHQQNDPIHEKDAGFASNKHELGAHDVPRTELYGTPGSTKGHELHGSPAAVEMEGAGTYQELAGSPVPVDYFAALKANEPSKPTQNNSVVTRKAIARSPLSVGRDSRRGNSPASPVSPANGPRMSSRATSGTSGAFLSADSEPRGERSSATPVSAIDGPRETSRTRGDVPGSWLSLASEARGSRSLASPVSSAESRDVSRSRTPTSETRDPAGDVLSHHPYNRNR